MGGGKGSSSPPPMPPPEPAPAPVAMSFEMPDFSAMYASQENDYNAKLAAQQAEAEKKAGLSQVSDLYSSKFDAANQATNDVNTQIADELAHAKTVGMDYTVNDADKQARINNAFANYWTQGQEDQLHGLVSKYGDAGYTWDLPIQIGTATPGSKTDKTPEVPAGKKVKAKGSAVAAVADPLGAANSILG